MIPPSARPQIVQRPQGRNSSLDPFQGTSEGGAVLHVWSATALIRGLLVAKCSCGYYTPLCDRVIDLEDRLRSGCPVENALIEGQRHRAHVWARLAE